MTTTARDRRLIVLAAVVLAAIVLLPGLLMGAGMMAGGMYGGGMGPGMYGGGAGPGWMWLVVLLMPLVAVALLVVLGYLAYRIVDGDGTDDAVAELRRAYARGEVSDEEFERRRERLRETD